jgi:hypothetical protein
MIPISLSLYQLHQAYNKHTLAGKAYTQPGNPYYQTPIQQCTCGAWFFNAKGSPPIVLYGSIAGRFAAKNPAILASLTEYWQVLLPSTNNVWHACTLADMLAEYERATSRLKDDQAI